LDAWFVRKNRAKDAAVTGFDVSDGRHERGVRRNRNV